MTSDGVIAWLESIYIYDQLDASRGMKHQYFGMDLGYSDDDKVKISMEQFTRKVMEEFPDPATTTAESPAGKNLFTVRDNDDPGGAHCRRTAHNSSTGRWHSCSFWPCVHGGTAAPPLRF